MIQKNALLDRLRLTHPILQAPMAGGGDTPEMVIAAGEAGGLGSIGCSYLTPEQIRAAAGKVLEASDRGFGVNLFAPVPVPDRPDDTQTALRFVTPYYQELGLDEPVVPETGGFDFDAQLAAVFATGATVFSFTFGLMPSEVIDAAKSRDMFVMGTATTIEEAVALEGSGVDAIVAQGAEAGGHRGTFLGEFGSGLVGTISLVPQIVDAVDIPVIASGGIADGRGIAAALVLGASAVQLGTAFLTCKEAGIPPAYKEAVLKAGISDTRITTAFSGRPARGINNRFMKDAERAPAEGSILPFPYQNALTRPIRAAAAQQGKADFLSLWAGQGLGLTRALHTGELIDMLAEETEAAIKNLDSI